MKRVDWGAEDSLWWPWTPLTPTPQPGYACWWIKLLPALIRTCHFALPWQAKNKIKHFSSSPLEYLAAQTQRFTCSQFSSSSENYKHSQFISLSDRVGGRGVCDIGVQLLLVLYVMSHRSCEKFGGRKLQHNDGDVTWRGTVLVAGAERGQWIYSRVMGPWWNCTNGTSWIDVNSGLTSDFYRSRNWWSEYSEDRAIDPSTMKIDHSG